MSQPATITSPHAPDVEDVRQWLEKMVKAMRLVEVVVAVVALITRMRDINTELTKRIGDMRRKRPRMACGGTFSGAPTRAMERAIQRANRRGTRDD